MKSLTAAFKIYISFTIAFLISLTISSTIFPIISTSAESISGSASSDISVSIENPYFITVSSSDSNINLDYTISSGNALGTIVTAPSTVTTTSNTGQAKQLYISTSSSSNDLTNDDTNPSDDRTYISAGGGDTLSSANALSINTWGFSLTDTTGVSNPETFVKVPSLGNEILVQEEIGEENPDTGIYESTKPIYFGALATRSLNPGTYTNTILYTAITEEPPEEPIEISSCSELETLQIGIHNDRKVQKLADNKCWEIEDTVWTGNYAAYSCAKSGFTRPDKSDFDTLLSTVGNGPELYLLGWTGTRYRSITHSDSNPVNLYVYSNNAYTMYYRTKNDGVTGAYVRCYMSN